MAKKISHISFLYKGERIIIKASKSGKFRVPVTNGTKTRYKYFTAKEVLQLKEIRFGDPSLTMVCGEKFRVFQGGDPSYLPALIDGILMSHDSQFGTTTSSKARPSLSPPPQREQSSPPFFDWYNDDYGY